MGTKKAAFKSIFLLSLLMTLVSIPDSSIAQEKANPNSVYARVNQIKDRLSQIYKKNLGTLSKIVVSQEFKGRRYYPRHVFQRVLDIERQITGLLKLNSLKPKPITVIKIQKYTPDHVMALANSIYARTGEVRTAIELPDIDKTAEKLKGKKPINVYVSLDRVETLLQRIGAPPVQPPDVLQRAQMVVHLISNLCATLKCDKLEKRPISEISLMRPIKVYAEVYRLIVAINDFEKKLANRIDGGILAPDMESGLIIPYTVHKVAGIILADLIEINRLNGELTELNIPRRSGQGSPIQVWREFDYARRLALSLAKNM